MRVSAHDTVIRAGDVVMIDRNTGRAVPLKPHDLNWTVTIAGEDIPKGTPMEMDLSERVLRARKK